MLEYSVHRRVGTTALMDQTCFYDKTTTSWKSTEATNDHAFDYFMSQYHLIYLLYSIHYLLRNDTLLRQRNIKIQQENKWSFVCQRLWFTDKLQNQTLSCDSSMIMWWICMKQSFSSDKTFNKVLKSWHKWACYQKTVTEIKIMNEKNMAVLCFTINDPSLRNYGSLEGPCLLYLGFYSPVIFSSTRETEALLHQCDRKIN